MLLDVAFYATYRPHSMGTFGAMAKLVGKKPRASESLEKNIRQDKVCENVASFATLKK